MAEPLTPPLRRKRSLADFVSDLEAAENPDQALLERTIESAARTDPALAEALRFCAIPRRFDAEIVAVLRDAPGDLETGARLLAGLRQHSFVVPRRDGGFVYHDTIRDLLLEDWRGTPGKVALFQKYNRRLVTFFETAHRGAQATEQSFARVAGTIARASKARYVQVAGAIEERLVAPLIAGLYHATLSSAEEGGSFFAEKFIACESEGRPAVCRSLLSAALEYSAQLLRDPERGQRLRWLRYYQARLARSSLDPAQAEKILRELLPETGDDTRLRLWSLSELGSVLQEQENLREARQLFQQELALAEETRADPYNLPLVHNRFAGIEWGAGELAGAAEQYRKGIACAAKENNPRVAVYAWMGLAGVLREHGAQSESMDAALEAFRLARGPFATDAAMQRALGERFLSILARRDPQIPDTVFAEMLGLSTTSEPFVAVMLRNQYATALREAGQLRRAAEVVRQIRRDAPDVAEKSFGTEILFGETLLLEDQGRLDEAVARYGEILARAEGGRGTAWHTAAALSNRGLRNSELGCFTEAESDLREAIVRWQVLDHRKLAGFVRVLLSLMLRRAGRLDDAQAKLDETRGEFENGPRAYLADFHRTQAALFRRRGRWAEAAEHGALALAAARSIDDLRNAAFDGTQLAEIASTQGRWADAMTAANDAAQSWQRLAAADACEPSPEAVKADEENARAVRKFCAPVGERADNVRAARDLFISASERVPGNAWVRLNLTAAHAELGDWSDAAALLEALLADGPEWLRSPVLHEWLAECRIKHGTALAMARDPGAEETLAAAEANLLAADRPGAPGLPRLADRWRELGDQFFKLGHREEAAGCYESGFGKAARPSPAAACAAARLGFLSAIAGDVPRAIGHFTQSLDLRGDDAGGLIADAAAPVETLAQFIPLAESLRLLARTPVFEESRRRALRSAFLELASRHRRLLHPRLDLTKRSPVVTPLVLAIDAAFFPTDDDRREKRLVNVELPALRERIRESAGVVIPGVTVRADTSLAAGVYAIYASAIPLAMDTVPAGEDDTVLADIMARLEKFLRARLVTFLGFQEVRELLKKWSAEDESRRAQWLAVLPDAAAEARFAQVLQGLASEGVPVRELGAVLAVFGGGEIGDIVENARAALGFRAPPEFAFVQLPPEIETELSTGIRIRDGKKFLALEAEKTSALLAAIQALENVTQPNAALVVRDPAVRPFARRLIAVNFPAMRVFAAREIAAS